MTLAETLVKQLENRALSRDARARLQCQIAADFEQRGQYDAARDALGDWWRGVGERPPLEGLSELTAAEILLRVGALSGWLGSVQQIEGAQDSAKDLISESITRFQASGETIRAAIAWSELGFCYRRAGAYDDARVVYREALKGLAGSGEREFRAEILLRLAIVESLSGHYNDALRILMGEMQFFAESVNDFLKGKFHNDLAGVLTCLSTAERRPDYIDRAIIEYTAASHHFESAGHTSYRASAESNLGFLHYTIERYEDAHEHLNAARRLFAEVRNKGRIAQVDETRARVLLAEGKPQAAENVIREAVQTLSKGGEQGLLAEALITQGRVLSRLGNFTKSLNTLRRAADLAEEAGASEDAGRALLSLIEEHADLLAEHELLETYERANNLLKETQDAVTVTRLRACALRIVSDRRAALSERSDGSRPADFWSGFNLNETVRTYEAGYIRRALIDGRGSVTRASRLLGLHHHATLAAMLDEGGRHKDLAHLRTPLERRRQSIINHKGRRRGTRAKARAVNILCVEDHTAATGALKETLEGRGWTVELCADEAEAMRKLESKAQYQLLILDNALPGADASALARRARQLPHRSRTPIILLSASDVQQEAEPAGVDAFLRKPQDIAQLPATVTRLLNKNTGA